MFRNVHRTTLILIFLSFLIGTPASAHTSVVKTTPSYKSTLEQMPETISIEFTDILMTLGEKKVNSIAVRDPNGSDIPLDSTEVNQRVLTVNLPTRSYIDGTYIISYRVVSADGHSISGSYELYLNTPSKEFASLDEHQSFFHIHQGHIIQGGVALIFITLWWAYRRFNREQGI